MATVFSETLTRLRKSAGFATAYRFYHDNGGKPVLELSYRKYLLMEQGKLLPVFARLYRLIFCLRAIYRGPQANELVLAWLKTMAGKENFDALIEPIVYAPAETKGLSPLHKAVDRALSDRKVFITPKQFSVIVANRGNYLCYVALSSDSGRWRPESLALKLKLPVKAMKKAMEALVETKILKRVRNGEYYCPFASEMAETPPVNMLHNSVLEKYKKCRDEVIASGKLEWGRVGILRADAQAFRNFYQMLSLNLSTAATYAITKKTEKSALFAVVGNIIRIRDF